jgi:hypothetical protein
LRSEKKHFIDTLRLIACRSETAMAGLVPSLFQAGGRGKLTG